MECKFAGGLESEGGVVGVALGRAGMLDFEEESDGGDVGGEIEEERRLEEEKDEDKVNGLMIEGLEEDKGLMEEEDWARKLGGRIPKLESEMISSSSSSASSLKRLNLCCNICFVVYLLFNQIMILCNTK